MGARVVGLRPLRGLVPPYGQRPTMACGWDDESAFYGEIAAHPGDDEPRRVFADWLEDRGDPRGEFIRLQCGQTAAGEHHEGDRRSQELLDENREHWLVPIRAALGAELADRIERFGFQRGFVHEVTVAAVDFLDHASRLFEAIPLLEGVCLSDARQAMTRLAGSPHLARLRSVCLASERGSRAMGNLGAQTLAESRHLQNLSCLSLANNGIGSPGVEALVRSDRLPELTALDLSGNVLGDGGLQALAAWSRLERLTSLDLGHNRIADEDAAQFLDQIGRLSVRLGALCLRANGLQVSAGRAIRRAAAAWSSLHSLDLSRNALGGDGAQALSEAWLPQVRDLDVSHNQLDAAAVQCLVRAFPNLRHLSLADNPHIGDRGLAALVELGLPGESLNLSGTSVGDAGLALLAGSPALASLHRVDLRNTLVGPDGIRALLESPYLARLDALCVSGANCGAEGVAAISQSQRLATIRELRLEGANIGAPGARRLAESPWLGGLRILELAGAGLGDAGAAALAAAKTLTGLRELALGRCRIGDAGAESLAAVAKFSRLVTLDLHRNELGDSGVRALALSPHLAALTELNLVDNPCADGAAEALVASPFLSRLHRLTLRLGAVSQRLQQSLRRRFGGRLVARA